MVFSLTRNKSIMTQRQSHGYLRIYAAVRVPQSWSTSFKPTRDSVLDLYSDGWSSDLLEFLSYDESSLVLRNIYVLPVSTRWETHPGLTLIGDAAHLMSPFAGEGMRILLRLSITSNLKLVIITILKCKSSYAGCKRIGARDYRFR